MKKAKGRRKRHGVRKPRKVSIGNNVGDSIHFAPHDDGVIVFETSVSAATVPYDGLFIKPAIARRMAADLIRMATWIETTGRV